MATSCGGTCRELDGIDVSARGEVDGVEFTARRTSGDGARPIGEAVAANFRLVEAPLPALRDGQVLVRHHFIS